MRKRIIGASILVAMVIAAGVVVWLNQRGSNDRVSPKQDRDGAIWIGAGYPDRWSVAAGEVITWHLHAAESGETEVQVTDAAEKVVARIRTTVRPQENTSPEAWQNGFNFQPTFSWTVPASLASGIYFLNGRDDLFMVVRGTPQQDIVVLHSTNTFNAYSNSGGRGLYSKPILAVAVSHQRPMDQAKSWQWLRFVQWLLQDAPHQERIRHIIDSDMEDAQTLQGAKLLMIVGHSEYWTEGARRNFDAFIDRGGHAMVLGGNAMWWKVEYDGHRMLCDKSKRQRWIIPALNFPTIASIGGDFEHGGYGQSRRVQHPEMKPSKGFRIVTDSPLLAGSGLKVGDSYFAPGVEYDGMPLKWEGDKPVPDLPAYRAEIVAFDYGYRDGPTVGTWHIYQKSESSGVVVHFGCLGITGDDGLGGPDGAKIGRLFANTISALVEGKQVFSSAAVSGAGSDE